MKYPQELVNRYGAKAGILMYVAQELPDIPQQKFVVKSPEESIDTFLQRADDAGIGWSRLFRSSAVDELYGYEGDFLTETIEGYEEFRSSITNPNYRGPYNSRDEFDKWVRDTVEYVEKTPVELKIMNPDLPDRVNVIAVEKSPSRFFGTYVKHPNQEDYYLISCSERRETVFDMTVVYRSNYYFTSNGGICPLEDFTLKEIEDNHHDEFPEIKRQLEEIVSWHDRISALPLMDETWTYQIEFGVEPPCLYQVRPFRKAEHADFQIEKGSNFGEVIAIGITPKQGIKAKVETGTKRKYYEGEPINPCNYPLAIFEKLRELPDVDYAPNLQVSLLTHSVGFLVHRDIKALRRPKVAALFSLHELNLKDGDWINVASDGRNVCIKKI